MDWRAELLKSFAEAFGQQVLNEYWANGFAREHANGETILFVSPGGYQRNDGWPAHTGTLLLTHRRIVFKEEWNLLFGDLTVQHHWRNIMGNAVPENWPLWAPKIEYRVAGNPDKHMVWPQTLFENEKFYHVAKRVLEVPAHLR